MADVFNSVRGKRLFGFIGAGGTAVALLGPIITIWLSVPLGPVNLMIAAAVFLELAVFCIYRLERAAVGHAGPKPTTEYIGGSAFAAIPELIRSPYMLGIGIWVALLSYAATVISFDLARLVCETVKLDVMRSRTFHSID